MAKQKSFLTIESCGIKIESKWPELFARELVLLNPFEAPQSGKIQNVDESN